MTFAALGVACGDDDVQLPEQDAAVVEMDAGAMDAGISADSATPDASSVDARSDAGVRDPVLWFEDVAVSAGIDFSRVPADGLDSLVDRMTGGVCVIDADGRAPLDLFFAMRPSASGGSRLYVGHGPLAYVDETSSRGLTSVGDASGCLAFDAEGDGDDDLLVTGLGSVRLLRNDAGSFIDVTATLGLSLDPRDLYMSAAAGDVDGDGDLDLLVAGFLRIDTSGLPAPGSCSPIPCEANIHAFTPIADLLLVRGPSGTYANRAADLAPDLARDEPTLCVAIQHLDGDGVPDLYVGNDLAARFRDRPLVRGTGSVFADASDSIGLAYNRRGGGIDTMGWSTGDIDGDGRLDHVATSWEGDATAAFLCGADGFCEDRAVDVGTKAVESSFRWGAALGDLDLDGRVDLFEATGHLDRDSELAAIGSASTRDQVANLLWNTGVRLEPVAPAVADALAVRRSTRGIALVDLDDDGRLDVVLAPSDGPPAVLHNVRPPVGRWLRVVLRGRGANKSGLGAVVTVLDGARTLIRERTAGEGYLGNFDPRLHFGIAGGGAVEVRVRWPSGGATTLPAVDLDREIEIAEP